MAIELSVRVPFAHWGRGDRITDPAQIAAVLASENAAHVTRVAVADPAPAPAPAPAAKPE